MSYGKLRVLIFLLEWDTWRDACQMPYDVIFGLEDGLRAQGIEPLIVTTPWLPQAQAICAGQKFDQVWIEIVHQNILGSSWLRWLSELAPVRLAFMPESLEYTPDELALVPRLGLRRHAIETRLKAMTHVLSVDEKDAAMLDARPALQAQWWPMSIPRAFIADHVDPPTGTAIFPGSAYGKRLEFLQHPALNGVLTQLDPPERDTIYPKLFDTLHSVATAHAAGRRPDVRWSLPAYIEQLRSIRRGTFGLWLEGLRSGSMVVNLPHMVKTYPGRVYESIAAGRPVISWDIPDRPRNRRIWEDGSEIVLFDGASPELLAEHILRLQGDPAQRRRLAENSLRKLRRVHTAEHRVRQILDWIQDGTAPSYE